MTTSTQTWKPFSRETFFRAVILRHIDVPVVVQVMPQFGVERWHVPLIVDNVCGVVRHLISSCLKL